MGVKCALFLSEGPGSSARRVTQTSQREALRLLQQSAELNQSHLCVTQMGKCREGMQLTLPASHEGQRRTRAPLDLDRCVRKQQQETRLSGA